MFYACVRCTFDLIRIVVDMEFHILVCSIQGCLAIVAQNPKHIFIGRAIQLEQKYSKNLFGFGTKFKLENDNFVYVAGLSERKVNDWRHKDMN